MASERDKNDPLYQRRRTYKGISSGVLFICIGTVLLLNTSGYLGWGVWVDLLRFWPVLLISMGLRLLFMNTPLHPVCLVGPILIIATTTWASMHYKEGDEWSWGKVSYAESVTVDCPAAPGNSPIDLSVKFAGGGLDLLSEPINSPAAGVPGQGSVPAPSPSGIKGMVRYVGEEPSVNCANNGDLRLGRAGSSAHDGIVIIVPGVYGDIHWEARLSAPRAVDASMEIGAANANLDLRALDLSHLDMDLAASNVTVRLGRPAARVPVKIDGAVTHLRIMVPEGTCVAVTRERVLNILDMEGTATPGRRPHGKNSPDCENLPTDAPRYDIRYELPVSTVSIETH